MSYVDNRTAAIIDSYQTASPPEDEGCGCYCSGCKHDQHCDGEECVPYDEDDDDSEDARYEDRESWGMYERD
jgi:hypothetical protein